jgi:hypothetical protein
MDMQDKEFDKVFRSNLDDFEIQPSPMVWDAIDNQLNNGRRKKALLPWLSVAASILVLICAGLLFIPKDIKTSEKHPVKNNVAVVKTPVNDIPKEKIKAGQNNPKITPVHQSLLAITKTVKHSIEQELPVNKQATKTKEKPVLAAINQKEQINTVVPDKTTPIAVAPIEDNTTFVTKPVVAETQLPVNTEAKATPVKTRHKLRTLGDLINLAVAKVDKRQDKFIEFTNTDDDDGSSITGVNLGILKIKKDK